VELPDVYGSRVGIDHSILEAHQPRTIRAPARYILLYTMVSISIYKYNKEGPSGIIVRFWREKNTVLQVIRWL
jgi:hypothetical protein